MTLELLAENKLLREKVEKYEKAIKEIKAEISQVTDEELSNYWHKRDRFLEIIDKHIGGET